MVSVLLPGDQPDVQRYFPFLSELRGVVQQIEQNLLDALGIPDKPVRQLRVFGQLEADLLFLYLIRYDADDVFNHLVHGKGRCLQIHLACLDLGEIEDVVDDAQHIAGRLGDPVDIHPLRQGETGPLEQIGHARDAVERRPDLMGHSRHKA